LSYHEIIARHSQPLLPQPTGEQPVLPKVGLIRAVLFDVYGTLIISGSGDVGTAAKQGRDDALTAALAACDLTPTAPIDGGYQRVIEVIGEHHTRAKASGVEYPEVDIVSVWDDVVNRLTATGELGDTAGDYDLCQLAVEFEIRTNPVWPMPGMVECLRAIRAAGSPLGIVSNAQFFTLEIFPALVKQHLAGLGFANDLQFYSYRYGQAKPGRFLYAEAATALSRRGIQPAEVLYVGNDLLNDIRPARELGFITALFAGDARSLRRREGDPRVDGVAPDLVVTDLMQIVEVVGEK
jgi:putative hydrolase of the HAD superfamily